MRRLVGWIGGTVGGITAYRLLRRRPRAAPQTGPPEPDARAAELREKLAESRSAEPTSEQVVDEPTAERTAEDEPAPEPESPEDRRRRVHEEGRSALDEMRPE